MAALAAVCGILIALFGLVATGRAPSEAQLSIEVTAFVGGLVLCFLAVVLARLKSLERRLGAEGLRSAAPPPSAPWSGEAGDAPAEDDAAAPRPVTPS